MGLYTAVGNSEASNFVLFSDRVEILESDDTITIRRMNPDGGFYHAEEVQYDDDSNSLSFDMGNGDNSINDNDGMTFLDALEDELDIDDLTGVVAEDNNMSLNYFHNNRYAV